MYFESLLSGHDAVLLVQLGVVGLYLSVHAELGGAPLGHRMHHCPLVGPLEHIQPGAHGLEAMVEVFQTLQGQVEEHINMISNQSVSTDHSFSSSVGASCCY